MEKQSSRVIDRLPFCFHPTWAVARSLRNKIRQGLARFRGKQRECCPWYEGREAQEGALPDAGSGCPVENHVCYQSGHSGCARETLGDLRKNHGSIWARNRVSCCQPDWKTSLRRRQWVDHTQGSFCRSGRWSAGDQTLLWSKLTRFTNRTAKH